MQQFFSSSTWAPRPPARFPRCCSDRARGLYMPQRRGRFPSPGMSRWRAPTDMLKRLIERNAGDPESIRRYSESAQRISRMMHQTRGLALDPALRPLRDVT
jgi:hypothetical protein